METSNVDVWVFRLKGIGSSGDFKCVSPLPHLSGPTLLGKWALLIHGISA